MPANLTGLTTISRQPSLRDYDPNRLHAFSLSSILHFSSQNETTLSDVLGDRPLAVHQDEQFGDSSFTILLYDAKSEKIKELVFSAEEDFDSSVLNILEPVEALVQEKVASHRTFDFEAGAHYCDPHLCETSLRCVLAQGNSNANLSERLKMLEDIKRAFSLPESTFEDVKTRAIEGTHCRLAEVQAQLKALEEDKGWALRPDQFENAALYKKCKSDNIKALLDVEALLQSLSPFSGEIQVSILSADKIANGVTRCSRARACYKWDMLPFVYCTITVTNANSKLDAGEDMNINYISKEAAFLDHVEWQEKSQWISINSLDDIVCIKLWQRNSHTQLSKAYRDLHLLSIIRSASYRWTKLNNLQALLQQQTILEATLLAKWESFSCDTTVGSMKLQKNYQSGDIKRTAKNNVDDSFSEERVGQRFEVLKSLARQSLSNVMGFIVECMQHGFTKRLQKLMDDCSTKGPDTLHIDDLELLTSYLDDHLKVLNEFLNPEIFRCLLLEIVGALIFCMEEFALNRDEDQHPMTAKQRIHLEEALNLFYDYFYGDGVGVSKDQMDNLSLRLRKILACSDLLTRDLCNLYWKAWDKLSAKEDATCESEEDAELHVLDFLLLLQQRDDDEARIIAANQKLMAKKRMLQTQYSSEKESLSKTHFEIPREVIRGVSQYLKAIPTQFPSLNVPYSAFQMVKKW